MPDDVKHTNQSNQAQDQSNQAQDQDSNTLLLTREHMLLLYKELNDRNIHNVKFIIQELNQRMFRINTNNTDKKHKIIIRGKTQTSKPTETSNSNKSSKAPEPIIVFTIEEAEEYSRVPQVTLCGHGAEIRDCVNLFNNTYDVNWVSEISLETYIKADRYDSMFENCESLSDIMGLDSIDLTQAKSLKAMFKNCKSLTEIEFRSKLEDKSGIDTSEMYMGCAKLLGISTDYSLLANYNKDTFKGCKTLEMVFTSGLSKNQLQGKEYERLLNTEIKALIDNIPTLSIIAFVPDDELNVYLSAEIEQGKVGELQEQEVEVYQITPISIDYLDKYFDEEPYDFSFGSLDLTIDEYKHIIERSKLLGLTIMETRGWAFIINSAAHSVELISPSKISAMYPGLFLSSHVRSVTNLAAMNQYLDKTIASLFENCKYLEYVEFTGVDTTRIEIIDRIFYECPLLKELDLRELDLSKVVSCNSAFASCKSLERIKFKKLNSGLNLCNTFTRSYELQEIIVPQEIIDNDYYKNLEIHIQGFSTGSQIHKEKLSRYLKLDKDN